MCACAHARAGESKSKKRPKDDKESGADGANKKAKKGAGSAAAAEEEDVEMGATDTWHHVRAFRPPLAYSPLLYRPLPLPTIPCTRTSPPPLALAPSSTPCPFLPPLARAETPPTWHQVVHASDRPIPPSLESAPSHRPLQVVHASDRPSAADDGGGSGVFTERNRWEAGQLIEVGDGFDDLLDDPNGLLDGVDDLTDDIECLLITQVGDGQSEWRLAHVRSCNDVGQYTIQ